jgi:molecular chaperone DnaK (HSP70)
MLRRVEKELSDNKQTALNQNQLENLIKICNCYYLQRRTSALVKEIHELILFKGKSAIQKVSINLLIEYFSGYVSINVTNSGELGETAG